MFFLFQLVFMTYGSALINTFILTSTWLTVTMATSRYLAICHPFRSRYIVGLTGTRVSITVVFLLCLLANIPRFFEYYIEWVPCTDQSVRLIRNFGFMMSNKRARAVYMWIYFSVGIFLPLTTLAFCNICLVRALKESSRLRRRCRVPAAHVDSNYRITSILVTIVVMYITLVSPAEIALFIDEQLKQGIYRTVPADNENTFSAMSMVVEATNVLQTVNFACNFVLYFVLNIHFRKVLKDLICTCVMRKKPCVRAASLQDSGDLTCGDEAHGYCIGDGRRTQQLRNSCSMNRHTDQTIL